MDNLNTDSELDSKSLQEIEDQVHDPSEGPLPKGSSKITEIAIGTTKVKVRTESTPASLKQIRELVNLKFNEFETKLEEGMSNEELSVLVAFNLAEELLQERERMRRLKRHVRENTERISQRVEAHLQRLTK